MIRRSPWLLAAALGCASLLHPADVRAFRMIQNTTPGRTSVGAGVSCTASGGFVHWNSATVAWRHNTAGQGGKPGIAAALQSALSAWTGVTPAGYTLAYAGTTNAGFTTDGTSTVLWATGNGCTGGCLAITALVLGPGQVITECDISFNTSFVWNTDGADYDVQAIAAHEFGHGMGIHHTEITKHRNRPTMYTAYFGTQGRTLEADDRDALNCAYGRYPPAGSVPNVAVEEPHAAGPSSAVRLGSRASAGRTTLRFALQESADVRLDVYDVSGRHLTTLASGFRAAGEHELAWDGATPSGRARAGVYFARLVTPAARATTTLVVTN